MFDSKIVTYRVFQRATLIHLLATYNLDDWAYRITVNSRVLNYQRHIEHHPYLAKFSNSKFVD